MEDDAVGLIHLDFLRGHDECLFLYIHLEESHGIRLMVKADQMLVIREQCRIFGIFAADGKAENLFKVAVIRIVAIFYGPVAIRLIGKRCAPPGRIASAIVAATIVPLRVPFGLKHDIGIGGIGKNLVFFAISLNIAHRHIARHCQ